MLSVTASSALWFLPFVIPVSIWVAWNDMKFMKIPNMAVLALLLIFAVVGLIAVPLADYPWRWVNFVVVLLIGFILSALRLVGAGDAKFAAAMAPFVAWGDGVTFVYLFSGILLAAFATHRVFRRIPSIKRATSDWRSWSEKDFPMGLALGASLTFYLLLAAFKGA